ncbi:MAG: glycerol-3-phosphate 1-O-acyltransferase PlsY [Anaerovoracaceae bacterium]
MLIIILTTIAAYLIGSINPAIIIAKANGIDIKQEGSGNAGTTNALRVLGKKAAISTLIIDILKGTFAVILAGLVVTLIDDKEMGHIAEMYAVIAVFLGHILPIYFKFKGGKGVATAFGALLGLNPLLALGALAVVLIVVLITKRMSAGSVAGAIAFPFFAIWLEADFVIYGAVLAAIVLIKHKDNVVRLIKGAEPKIDFSKFKKNK